jgi:hypothetical protein
MNIASRVLTQQSCRSADLPSCEAVPLGKLLPTFRQIVLLSSVSSSSRRTKLRTARPQTQTRRLEGYKYTLSVEYLSIFEPKHVAAVLM